jgi:hypothetical protein
MTDYSILKSMWLEDLRTLHSRAVTARRESIWKPGWLEERLKAISKSPALWSMDHYPHSVEEVEDMRADLEQVIIILDKYKKKGKR